MKKITALTLVMALSLTALTACGGTKEPASAGTESTAAPDSQAPATSDAEAAAPSGDASSFKVAAIFGGAINDGNWNETQYNGLKKIEALGAETSYMENVSDTDAAEAARTYASEGYNLVYLTTNSYQDYCTPVANDFPDTTFIQINGTAISDNFISVRIADEEQGFLQGVAAALITKTGKVGFVGGQEINPIKLGSSGFQQGVDYVNATYGLNVTADRINTGSFTDVNQAKETAISIIESGADVIAPMANDASTGIMEAGEEKGVMAIGCGLGQETSAPTATELIIVKDVSIAFDVTFEALLNGELKATEVETYGANKGVVYATDWMGSNADDEAKSRLQETIDKMSNGEIEISTQ
ncbi:MAG: BMP family protein [Lachnospiraceae bacterium]